MTTLLSDCDAATLIISAWKGFHVRKIFSTMEKIESWSEFDDIRKNPAAVNFSSAWEAALDKADHRLRNAEQPCFCDDCCYRPEYDDSDPGDWMWNDGGGYNDW